MSKTATIVLVLACALESCTFSANTYGTWKNARIDKDKRAQIKALNDKLIKSLKNNDVRGAKSIMSDVMIEKAGANIDSIVLRVSPAFSEGTYRIMDEYNVRNISANSKNSIPGIDAEGHRYRLNYLALNEEMYASLLLVESGNSEVLTTAIYGNYGDKWKLNILQIGDIRYYRKSAPDFYAIARKEAEKMNLVDAYDNVALAAQTLKPANEIFEYENAKEIKTFNDSLIAQIKVKYPLPLTMSSIKTQAKVFSIYPEKMAEGYFPMIRYLSTIDLKDTVMLKKENDEIKKESKKLFTGLGDEKKYIFYQAFNEIPDGKHLVYHYGFGEILKN